MYFHSFLSDLLDVVYVVITGIYLQINFFRPPPNFVLFQQYVIFNCKLLSNVNKTYKSSFVTCLLRRHIEQRSYCYSGNLCMDPPSFWTANNRTILKTLCHKKPRLDNNLQVFFSESLQLRNIILFVLFWAKAQESKRLSPVKA